MSAIEVLKVVICCDGVQLRTLRVYFRMQSPLDVLHMTVTMWPVATARSRPPKYKETPSPDKIVASLLRRELSGCLFPSPYSCSLRKYLSICSLIHQVAYFGGFHRIFSVIWVTILRASQFTSGRSRHFRINVFRSVCLDILDLATKTV